MRLTLGEEDDFMACRKESRGPEQQSIEQQHLPRRREEGVLLLRREIRSSGRLEERRVIADLQK